MRIQIMKTMEKWLERIYIEKDLDKNIAISVSGTIGLLLYLYNNNVVIGLFLSIISFPIIRILSISIIKKVELKKDIRIYNERKQNLYKSLSENEKKVVKSFVKAGGFVMTWGQMNDQDLPFSAIESLCQRELLRTSVSADGIKETFVLNDELFDIARVSN